VPEIPQKYERAFRDLVELESDNLALFSAALKRIRPSLSYSEILENIGPVPGIDGAKARRLVELAIWLGSLEGEYRQTNGFKRLLSSIRDMVPLEQPLMQILLDQRVSELADNDVVRLVAKAADIVSDNKTNFQDARIISEIRPVFSDADEIPKAAVVVHNCKIVHYEDFASKEFYFTLETKDLVVLRAVVDRALKKAEQLEKMLSDFGVQYLKSELEVADYE
jgi:hypothetical protein